MKTIKFFALTIMLVSGLVLYANDSTKVSASVGADFVSHYVWRGLLLGNSPAIQPTASISYSGFSFGSWASYSFSQTSFQEVDLYLSYSLGSFNFGINDYFNPADTLGAQSNYFKFKNKSTLHTIEPFVTMTSIAGTPLSATAAVFVYGNDKDISGKNQYSTYLEISYGTTIGAYNVNLFGGGTFNKGYYAANPALVNIGATVSKEIKVSDSFTIPCKGSFIVNPDKENVFLVLSLTF